MIPPFKAFLRPVLEIASTGEVSIQQTTDKVAVKFDLTEDERRERVPSGTQTKLHSRVSWARTHLAKALLVQPTKPAHFTITERGRSALKDQDALGSLVYLEKFPEYMEFKKKRSDRKIPTGSEGDVDKTPDDVTPEEAISEAHGQIIDALAADLLERVQASPPAFFEELIVDLLRAMGYGLSEESGRVLGGSGDGGVDGVIDQDKLGIDQIFVQAKRYGQGTPVGPSAIQSFFGALNMKNAQKGIFFTTSSFSIGAIEAAKHLGARIILIDGERLSRLMVEHEVGCRRENTLVISKLDEGYFPELVAG